MSIARVAVGVAIGLTAFPSAAQRPTFSHEIVVEPPASVERTVRRLDREGYSCAAVARPEGRLLSHNVAIFMTRPLRAASASEFGETAIVTGTADGTADFERRVNISAAQGFRLCGITITAPIWGKPSVYATVAVMTRAAGSSASTTYRVVRSRGRREDWTVLEKAAAEGFGVTQLAAISEPGPSNVSDIVFVAERPEIVRPLQYRAGLCWKCGRPPEGHRQITVRGFRFRPPGRRTSA